MMRAGKRGAVRNNSGLPVHQSGPGLGRANNFSNSRPNAGGLPTPSPLSQPKTGRGLGQSPSCASEASAVLRSEATQPSSLDKIQINRDSTLEAVRKRGKYCGRYTVRGFDESSQQTAFHRVNCKCWSCSFCGPRRARRCRRAIREQAESHQLSRLLTLTLDPSKIEGESVRYLNDTFAKLRVYLKRQFRVTPQYIRILEFQQNGNPHFHILIDRYIPQSWIATAWSAVGGGHIVDIRYIDIHRVSHYLSKYLTKELLLSAPIRSRRVTTSRGIRLFEKKPTATKWQLIRIPVWILFEFCRNRVLSFSLDSENVLQSFSALGSAI